MNAATPSPRARERALAVMLLCATVVIWGLSFVSTKAALAAFPPMTLAVARFAVAALVLYPLKRRLAPNDRLARTDLPKVAAAGLVGVSIYFLFENYGIKLTTASESALIVASIPTLTLAVEAMRARGGTRPLQWLGSLLSFVGVGCIVVNGLQLSGSAAGYACMVGADFSWVAYTLLTRELASRYSQVALVFWQSIAGLGGLLPLLLVDVGRMGKPTLMILVHVGFLAIACSALGYWFYAHALRVLGAAATSVYINVIPVVAVAVGVSVGEKLGALQFGGGAMVVLGVLVATRAPSE